MKVSLSGICERDLDLFLIEELVADTGLLAWILGKCDLGDSGVADYSIVHSASGSNGETDVEVSAVLADGRDVIVLIENKIAASFQRRQAERYRERASNLRRNHRLAKAVTLLFAPKSYLDPEDSKHGFDCQVSYEDVLEWLRARDPDDPRLRYKELLLGAAIEKSRRGYAEVADGPVSAFWHCYWQLACEHCAELNFDEPEGKASGSTFVTFRAVGLPRGVSLLHKLDRGFVDLQVAGWGERVGELRKVTEAIREEGMTVHRTNKSAAIRLRVPALDVAASAEEQAEPILTGLSAANRMLRWAREHEDVLQAILRP